MSPANSTVRVAAVQAEPVWFDLAGSVAKACALIAEAAQGGAALVAFPECFVPGFPVWIFSRHVDTPLTVQYMRNSMAVDSAEMNTIRAAAKENSIDVVLGFSENDNNSLYIAQVTISGQTGEILMRRRKIKPTHMERTVFGEGSGDSLMNVVDTSVGRVGALACWEHHLPLLKYHTFTQREEIHVSMWPVTYPYVEGEEGHWGTTQEGATALAQTYAVEGGCFVIHASCTMNQEAVDRFDVSKGVLVNRPGGGGSSAIFGPDGRLLSKRLGELEQGIVYADLDLDALLATRTFVDNCGHYSRPDLLWVGADARAKKTTRYLHEEP